MYLLCLLCIVYRFCLKSLKNVETFFFFKQRNLLFAFSDDLFKLRSNKTGEKLNCDCYPLCDDVNYVLQSNVSNNTQETFVNSNKNITLYNNFMTFDS